MDIICHNIVFIVVVNREGYNFSLYIVVIYDIYYL